MLLRAVVMVRMVMVGETRNTGSVFFFVFFSLPLSVSVWPSEGTLALQCSEARSRIHSDTAELLSSGEWM